MAAGPRTLKLAGAAGSLVVCGAAGLAVAVDTKPASAPLKPPVSGGPTTEATAQTDSSGGLVIPAGATCAQPAQASRGAERATPPPVPSALQAIVQQYAQAKTQQQRQQVLSSLTPDQRMQVTAFLQQVAQARGKNGGNAGLGLSCLGGASAQSAGSGGAQINSDVVAGESSTPISVSAVS